MVSKTDDNGQIDADILQCKADILRARDIIPPSKKKARQEPKAQKTDEKTTPPADATETSAKKEKKAREDTVPIPIEAISPPPKEPAPPPAEKVNKEKAAKRPQEKTEIPRFDLAEEIMAEQRKIAATRRRAPDKKIEAEELKVEPTGYTVAQLMPEPPEQQIIAEIVTRDIERLHRGDYSADSK